MSSNSADPSDWSAFDSDHDSAFDSDSSCWFDCWRDEDFAEKPRSDSKDGFSVQIHHKFSICFENVFKSKLQDFHALEQLVRRTCWISPWRDFAGIEVPIANTSDLLHSINVQTRDGSNKLHFYASVRRKRPLPSSSSLSSSSLLLSPRMRNKESNELMELVRYWGIEGKEELRSPLFAACEAGHLEGAKALVQCTFDMVQGESKFLKKFMKKSVQERIDELEPFEADSSALEVATWLGHTHIVSFLLSLGATIREKEEDQRRSMLHSAVEDGHQDIVALLLAAGAAIDLKDSKLNTPLHIAAEKGRTEIVSLLIAQRANLEAENEERRTPLHVGIENGQRDIVDVLIAHRANIEAKIKEYQSTDSGAPIELDFTPLHVAAKCGHTEILALLINAKVDLMAKNEIGGNLALELAQNHEITSLLSMAIEAIP